MFFFFCSSSHGSHVNAQLKAPLTLTWHKLLAMFASESVAVTPVTVGNPNTYKSTVFSQLEAEILYILLLITQHHVRNK